MLKFTATIEHISENGNPVVNFLGDDGCFFYDYPMVEIKLSNSDDIPKAMNIIPYEASFPFRFYKNLAEKLLDADIFFIETVVTVNDEVIDKLSYTLHGMTTIDYSDNDISTNINIRNPNAPRHVYLCYKHYRQ